MSEEKTDKQKALERARKRYDMDYRGILLNSFVSILSSASATAITSALTAIPASQLPAVAVAIFVAQILPKVLIEVHKSYIKNKAMREGFSEGLLNDSFDEGSTNSKSKTTLSSFLSMCEHMSYY